MATRTEPVTGCAAALATAVLTDDSEALEQVLDSLPRPLGRVLPLLLADAARLLRDAACASVRLAIYRPADEIDVRAAWEDCSPSMGTTLAHLHGFEPGDLGDWLDWATGVLLEDDTSVPACDQARYLALTLSLVAEMFAAHEPTEWQRFLLQRCRSNFRESH